MSHCLKSPVVFMWWERHQNIFNQEQLTFSLVQLKSCDGEMPKGCAISEGKCVKDMRIGEAVKVGAWYMTRFQLGGC